jgi:hypothetical protein
MSKLKMIQVGEINVDHKEFLIWLEMMLELEEGI